MKRSLHKWEYQYLILLCCRFLDNLREDFVFFCKIVEQIILTQMDPEPDINEGLPSKQLQIDSQQIQKRVSSWLREQQLGHRPIIGNSNFQQQLQEFMYSRLDQTAPPGMLLLIGQPGVGKTALIRKLSTIYSLEYKFIRIPYCQLVVSGKEIYRLSTVDPQFNIFQYLVQGVKSLQPVLILDEIEDNQHAKFLFDMLACLMTSRPWVPVIGITNHPERVVPSAWPPIARLFYLQPPSTKERQQKLIELISEETQSIMFSHINTRFIAEQTLHYTYSDLYLLVKEALHQNIRNLRLNAQSPQSMNSMEQKASVTITQKYFDTVILQKGGKMMMEAKKYFDESVTKLRAEIFQLP